MLVDILDLTLGSGIVKATYKWGDKLERIWHPRLRSRLIEQDKSNLNDSGQTSRHQRIPKELMHLSGQHKMLWVSTHSPTSDKYNETRDEVALSASWSQRQPDAAESSCPPNNSHNCMLDIISNPIPTPSMLCKRVDTSPSSNHRAIKELLAPPCPPQPGLAHQQHEQHDYAVADKGAAHDEVREALPEMVVTAKTERCDAAEEHL